MFSYFKNKYYRNQEMVKYWKTQDSVKAKLTTAPEGHYVLEMDGEKYPFPGYPRGVLLHGVRPGEYGKLSRLKHEIKNQVFNAIWYKLEDGKSEAEILSYLYGEALPNIYALFETMRYDQLPYEKLVPPVKELWRAMASVEAKTGSQHVRMWKEILCFIFQEDDAYRMRFQWLSKLFTPSSFFFKIMRKDTFGEFDYAMGLLEHAEIVGDMKERVRLWTRGLQFLRHDPGFRQAFLLLSREMDWKKLRLTKADKYFLRGKYFRCDYPEYSY